MTTIDAIDDNLSLAGTTESIDQINAKFYGRFPFPWRPGSVERTSDPDFSRVMLNQNLGDWTHQAVPAKPRIWVAGCGANQGPITALHFPNAEVIGSDLSTSSLEISASTARDFGCTNLDLRNESINGTTYDEEFDYIICTGVIHHNADPEATLRRLTAALKPTGVLELMVYNRYHRILTSAFQKAVRLLTGTESQPEFQKEFAATRQLIDHYQVDGLMGQFVNSFKQSPDVEIADALIQPVENSYTVEVLEEMARRCGLEFLMPCPTIFDRGRDTITWNLRLPVSSLQEEYIKLPDSRRWQIANLLLCEKSPTLWFYFKRSDSPAPRKTEKQICDDFLETRFRPNTVTRYSYVLNKENRLARTTAPVTYPGVPAKPELRNIVEASKGILPTRRILESLRIPRDFTTVNDLRLRLTTSMRPHLRSIT
jgi:2-polyprenyl-3-methyl-5-hydroxy-6-metoxy-1,4-benzoquinol methylase